MFLWVYQVFQPLEESQMYSLLDMDVLIETELTGSTELEIIPQCPFLDALHYDHSNRTSDHLEKSCLAIFQTHSLLRELVADAKICGEFILRIFIYVLLLSQGATGHLVSHIFFHFFLLIRKYLPGKAYKSYRLD